MKRIILVIALMWLSPAAHGAMLIMAGLDVYSPESILPPGGGVDFYFGGWRAAADIPIGGGGDKIFETVCGAATCADPIKVLDPAGTEFYAFNDPSVVWKPPYAGYLGYYLGYLTCSINYPNFLEQDICLSTSFDGTNWSTPFVVEYHAWAPSPIVANDQVWLYANDDDLGGHISYRYMGYSGALRETAQPVLIEGPGAHDGRFSNPAVRVDANGYRMLAEHDYDDGTSRVDELSSSDGINWTITTEGIVVAADVPGAFRVGTPAYLTSDVIMFGATPRTDSEGFNIYAIDRGR